MDFLTIVLLLLAAVASGAINAVAGGGTFIVFGTLTLLGVPPVMANATSSIAQLPGYITSTLAYWSDIRRLWRHALLLVVASALGGLLGALILLALNNAAFRALVPWLLLAATALFAAGPWLVRWINAGDRRMPEPLVAAVQLVASIYGGFFGAGMGVIMLATLGLAGDSDYHRINAVKNLLSIVIAIIAIAVFISGGIVSWPHALVMIPGVAFGGYGGVWVARRVPQPVLRAVVIAIGVVLAVYYFVA
jgi:uncharacterized membrane protein YfcA